ncbi:hypothetical protein [Aurantimonas coralicida]|uniref:hypothetical protein n=1 Tax=Aurantimonas coralicida TaxID=182270 RepID=UPI001D188190|nr:hypothetical protein [Aurantimonas coralicida]MCC4298406.1 hypothetical protein [Aurantimonas coralicida]
MSKNENIIVRFTQVGTQMTTTASYKDGKLTATATGYCPREGGPEWRERFDALVCEAGNKVRAKIAEAAEVAS